MLNELVSLDSVTPCSRCSEAHPTAAGAIKYRPSIFRKIWPVPLWLKQQVKRVWLLEVLDSALRSQAKIRESRLTSFPP